MKKRILLIVAVMATVYSSLAQDTLTLKESDRYAWPKLYETGYIVPLVCYAVNSVYDFIEMYPIVKDSYYRSELPSKDGMNTITVYGLAMIIDWRHDEPVPAYLAMPSEDSSHLEILDSVSFNTHSCHRTVKGVCPPYDEATMYTMGCVRSFYSTIPDGGVSYMEMYEEYFDEPYTFTDEEFVYVNSYWNSTYRYYDSLGRNNVMVGNVTLPVIFYYTMDLQEIPSQVWQCHRSFWGPVFPILGPPMDCADTTATDTTDVGIKNVEWEQIGVYPNPASEQVTVTNKGGIEQVTIRDMTGRTMLRSQGEGSEIRLDVSDFPKGLYILEVQTTKGFVARKLVID